MKDFTNNNFEVKDFAHRDEARIRHISLKGLIIILVIVFTITAQIVNEYDLDMGFNSSKYTIEEIEEMAEVYWEEAKYLGYTYYRREDYVIDKLEDRGVKVERYNITFDSYGNARVDGK